MTQSRPLPSLETLREVLAYDPDTGALTWLVSHRRVRMGSPAGCLSEKGYVRVVLGSRSLRAHRIAWMLHYGEDPGELLIDHINRNRSDNRISNLRLVDAKGNQANSSCPVRPVQVIYPSGETRLFPSGTAAAAALGCHPVSLRRYARGQRQHPDGITISYIST
jgi:hypothetical protein